MQTRQERWGVMIGLTALLLAPFGARAEKCEAKEVVRERSETTRAGVTRSEKWTERLLRCGDEVWIERVGAAPLEDNPRERREPDLERAAWYLKRQPDGSSRLWLVFRELKMIIEARPGADYDRLQFDGKFDAAAEPRDLKARQGNASLTVHVRALPAPKAPPPWTELDGFAHKTLDELGD
jgi:hypothetical protein